MPKRRAAIAVPVLFFCLAVGLHFLYDLWVQFELISRFSYVTVIAFWLSTGGWFMMKNNCLNNSSFFQPEQQINVQKLQRNFCMVFSISFSLAVIYEGLNETSLALQQFLAAYLLASAMLICLLWHSRRIELNKDRWFSLTESLFSKKGNPI